MPEDIDRIEAFMRWYEEITSTRTEPFRWGTALFNDDFPMRYDSNFLRLERSLGDATPHKLAAEADRALDGFAHREIFADDIAEADRIAAGMGDLGYKIDRLLFMRLTEKRPRPSHDIVVEEFDFDTMRPHLVEVARRYEEKPTDEVAAALADFGRVLVDRVGARFFGVRVDGRPVASCELYVHEGVAQIEDVGTLEEFRGLGFARAFVSRAIIEGIDAGADLVFLIADDDDWPKEFYGRLGFESVRGSRQFTKAPPRPTPGEPLPERV
jgi:ribosomal protein S18 acetylase RimI-like enzyme